MTIATYSELVEELEAWLDRADLSARIPTFIRLFEARINRVLRTPEMECSATQTTVAGTDTYALPSDFREMRLLYLGSSPRTYPIPMSPQSLRSEFTGEESGPTSAYCISGSNLILAPAPTTAQTMTLVYFEEVPALESGSPTNWLLADHPDAYLFGSLCMAEAYLKDDARVMVWKQAWDEALSEIKSDANRKRLPGGPLAMRPATIE